MEEKIYSEFADVTRHAGQEVLIPIRFCSAFVAACDRYDLAIIGVDCFEVTEAYLRPVNEMILDFSGAVKKYRWKIGRDICNKAAAKFFRENEILNVYCSFVLLDHIKWAKYSR